MMAKDKGTEVQDIAVDIGYGDVKVVTKDSAFKFPSAVARANISQADFDGAEEIYEFNGRRWMVGQDAIHGAVSTRGFEFLIKYGPLLIFVAIKKAGLDMNKPIRLATGLSIVDWGSREQFKEVLGKIIVNGTIIEPIVPALYAQGQGIFKDVGLNYPLVCVVDIGYNTLDYLVFKNGMPSPQDSKASRQGAHYMITKIQDMVSKRFNTDISEQFAKEIFIKKGIQFGGTLHDLSDEIAMESEDYSEYIISEISAKYPTYNRADKVVFSGGGSYYLDVKKVPNAVFSKNPFEFSNVRGYFSLLGQ